MRLRSFTTHREKLFIPAWIFCFIPGCKIHKIQMQLSSLWNRALLNSSILINLNFKFFKKQLQTYMWFNLFYSLHKNQVNPFYSVSGFGLIFVPIFYSFFIQNISFCRQMRTLYLNWCNEFVEPCSALYYHQCFTCRLSWKITLFFPDFVELCFFNILF